MSILGLKQSHWQCSFLLEALRDNLFLASPSSGGCWHSTVYSSITPLLKSAKSLLSYKRTCTGAKIRTLIALGTIHSTITEEHFELGPYSGSDPAQGKWDDTCTLCSASKENIDTIQGLEDEGEM